MTPPTRGVVALAALDARKTPDHRAELTTQFLLGEVVRLLRSVDRGAWWQVEGTADGYRGWVRGWGFVPVAAARARSWEAKATARVAVPVIEARVGPGSGARVSPLVLNSVVIPGRRRGRFRAVELPDARRGWVPLRSLAGEGERPALLDRVRSLLGIPYHWGGRTPLGFDCSGFVQQVLAEQGVQLPRDTVHQWEATARLAPLESPTAGDLVFFAAARRPAGHVGIGLGGGFYAHCRGVVRISSLDPASPLCDRELLPQLLGWGRCAARSGRGRRRGPAR